MTILPVSKVIYDKDRKLGLKCVAGEYTDKVIPPNIKSFLNTTTEPPTFNIQHHAGFDCFTAMKFDEDGIPTLKILKDVPQNMLEATDEIATAAERKTVKGLLEQVVAYGKSIKEKPLTKGALKVIKMIS